MRANAAPILAIFEQKLQLEVPLFQRQYVWSLEAQWRPLWEDIARKFQEYLEGRKDAPVHFLGAMVLDQLQTPVTHVAKRQVIDGQQRLTTLQVFLAAFRDFCRESGTDELAKECETFTLNKGMMANAEVDPYKVWPTLLDRPQFIDVITSGSRVALETKHPRQRQKYARTDDPRPRMVEAYVFFHDELAEFFLGAEGSPPLAFEAPLAKRLEECFQALKNSLQVVAIDLEPGDDAQVIFETLNARGEPLLPADLLRNYIFLRAARLNEPQEKLYDDYWKRFDDEFWRQEVKQGRLNRPRSDLFMQHFLASRQTVDIPVKHLFVEYKFWIEHTKPFTSVRDELATLARQGDDFRRIVDPKPGDVLFPLAAFLESFDIRTSYPLLLHLLDVKLTDSDWKDAARSLESYLLRRAVCCLTTKNYNRVFLGLTHTLRQEGYTSGRLRGALKALTGESAAWPSDAEFEAAWREKPAYQVLQQQKLVHLLRRVGEAHLGPKSETITIDSPLTLEHIMPQRWQEHWPLADGSTGMTDEERWASRPGDPRAEASKRRSALVQTLGNLTLLTQALNSGISNLDWPTKKAEVLAKSLLPINLELHAMQAWDEATIEARSRKLFETALTLWPGPSA